MHGIVHTELKKYIETRHGDEVWSAVIKQAGLASKIYMPVHTYPDEEITAIVSAASALTGETAEAILEDFGEFLAPTLMKMYKFLVKPEWRTMELLLHTEDTIHRVVRLKNPGAQPPQLKFEQVGPRELRFTYDSPRQMPAVARGIMKGVADHYGEELEIHTEASSDGAVEMSIEIR